MKGNHWFIAGIIVFLVLMFAIECRLPKKFVWNPTFSHYDKQPFGCAVFDSLLSSSLPKGYSLSRKTFYELEQEDTTLRRGILVVTDNLHLTDVDVEAMLKMAGRGDRIMLAGSSFSRILKDTLGFECSYSYFSPSALKKYATALLSKDSLCWVGDSAVYPQQTFCFCQPILQVVRHIRLTANILQKVDAVGYRRLAKWRKAERYANFSFRHGKARCAHG